MPTVTTGRSKTVHDLRPKPPWLTDHILAEVKLKDKRFKLCKINRSLEKSNRFRMQRNKVTALLRRAKKSVASGLDSAVSRAQPQNFWYQLRNKTAACPIASLQRSDGTLNAKADADKTSIFFSKTFPSTRRPHQSNQTNTPHGVEQA